MQTTDLSGTRLYQKTLGCLLGGIIGDAIGTPTEGWDYRRIEEHYGWVSDLSGDGTDDTVMKNLLAEALIRTGGYATLDDWAQVWIDHWSDIFGDKYGKFFISVIAAAQKVKHQGVPRMAALGNLPSSSSAMCISPVGIVNACNPTQAALQAYNLGSLIHAYDVGFCQDGAAAMAAAVAAAMKPDANVESVLEAATGAIIKLSGCEMLDRIEAAMQLARTAKDYKTFRSGVYEASDRFFCRLICDSRETIPLTLALFYLAQGDLEQCVTYGANLGRDSDTIGSMAGAIAGALGGATAVKSEWASKVQSLTKVDQEELATRLVEVAVAKQRSERAAQALFNQIASP